MSEDSSNENIAESLKTKTYGIRISEKTKLEFKELVKLTNSPTEGAMFETLLETFHSKTKPEIKEVSKQDDIDLIDQLTKQLQEKQIEIDELKTHSFDKDNVIDELKQKITLSSNDKIALQDKLQHLENITSDDHHIIIHVSPFEHALLEKCKQAYGTEPADTLMNLFNEQILYGPNEKIRQANRKLYYKLKSQFEQ